MHTIGLPIPGPVAKPPDRGLAPPRLGTPYQSSDTRSRLCQPIEQGGQQGDGRGRVRQRLLGDLLQVGQVPPRIGVCGIHRHPPRPASTGSSASTGSLPQTSVSRQRG